MQKGEAIHPQSHFWGINYISFHLVECFPFWGINYTSFHLVECFPNGLFQQKACDYLV